MPACLDFRRIRSRLQDMRVFRRKEKKRTLIISAPFNFKKETTYLPGITDSEISVLREKAAASCLGVRHDDDPTALGPLRIPSPVNIRSISSGPNGSPLSSISGNTW
ncbi:hypothetical protein NKR19_g6541 [Coniochaeta hoffmannii]|uniref:Uncharacterized protein n=1 Tax=Coniochaeta hoffmannii TaxID=91930 RepID=A0AA38RM79_9PEZI|nr:hypothetical protein NKR19_g6541 [Coniochaeta hoffmannii]